jgi:aspartyl-tRNA(Asn)/glutamyl-tRNA(Gln) amidotransferase subunit C
MKISREDVLRVAELAHLGLSPEEVETYQKQLDAILTYVDKLSEINLTTVEPMAQVLYSLGSQSSTSGEHPELREDALRPCDVAADVLARATDASEPFFRVPKVIDR